MRRAAYAWLWLCGAALGLPAQTPGEYRGRADDRTFLEHALAVIRAYAQHTTSFVADVTLSQRVPGLIQTIKSDCRITRTPVGIVIKDVRSPYPYIVTISNAQVITDFPATQERDQRALLPGETPLDFMLGVPDMPVLRDYDFSVRIEDELYVLTALVRPAQRVAWSADVPGNAHRVVRCVIAVQPHQRRIVRTQRVTLAGEEAIYEVRAQWLNSPAPQ
jgi:hypothetical protein